jgi:polysaccharide export outer membrane protein
MTPDQKTRSIHQEIWSIQMSFPRELARRRAIINRVVVGLIISCVCIPLSARAEYHLSPGDILELSAVGLDELRQQTTIAPNGTALFPLLGPVKAAGLSIAELRMRLGELLPGKVFRRKTSEGRDVPMIISADEILVTVAQYRPIYVDGDVSKPGEQSYRPGMTVRQAVALAGGYDVVRLRGHDPFLESADFRAEYYSLWTEFAKQEAYIARLKSELEHDNRLDTRGLSDTPIPNAISSQIHDRETEQLLARITDRKKEMDHLARAIAQEDARISVLKEQQQKEQEGAQADATDLVDMRENFKRGLIPVMRMSEARRLALLSATQALQTTAMLAQAEREREDFSRRLEVVDDRRRVDLLGELQDAEVKLQKIRASLQAVSDKLLYSSMVRSQLARGKEGKPTVTVFRDSNGDRQTLPGDENSELMPGDVVEIALRLEEMSKPSQ